MRPIPQWLEEEMQRNGMDSTSKRQQREHPQEDTFAGDTTFVSDHHVFDIESPSCNEAPDELYVHPVKVPKPVGKAAREQQAVLAQVVNTFASLEATTPPDNNFTAGLTDAEKFGRDAVTLPHHYARYAIEPIRFAVENNLNFLQANIVKYVLRFDAKNGIEDLDKAMRYLTLLKRFAQHDPDWWRA